MYFSCGRDTNHWGPGGGPWWTDFKVALTFPSSWCQPSCERLLLSVNGNCHLLLTSRIWRRQWDICDYVYMTTLRKIVVHLARRPPSLAGFEGASCPVVNCHRERAVQQGAESRRQRDSARKWGPQSDNLQEAECSRSYMSLKQIRPQSNFWSPLEGGSQAG